jgi:hypothetical protein
VKGGGKREGEEGVQQVLERGVGVMSWGEGGGGGGGRRRMGRRHPHSQKSPTQCLHIVNVLRR